MTATGGETSYLPYSVSKWSILLVITLHCVFVPTKFMSRINDFVAMGNRCGKGGMNVIRISVGTWLAA